MEVLNSSAKLEPSGNSAWPNFLTGSSNDPLPIQQDQRQDTRCNGVFDAVSLRKCYNVGWEYDLMQA